MYVRGIPTGQAHFTLFRSFICEVVPSRAPPLVGVSKVGRTVDATNVAGQFLGLRGVVCMLRGGWAAFIAGLRLLRVRSWAVALSCLGQ